MRPLDGIRIVDFTRLLPGPYMTQLLADLGAEVIKVESTLAGDYARLAPAETGLDGLFEAVNGGKKSLAINHRRAEGRAILYKLVATADVFVEGFRPGAVKRWKLDYETLRQHNPALIYLSLSGYGQSGPYRDRAGHDLNYQSVGGSLGLNGLADGQPVPPSIPLADLGGATFGAIAILSALLGRERGANQGLYIDMALMDAVVAWMAPLAGGPFFKQGVAPQRGRMPLAGGLACFNVYATADGEYLSLAALEPHLWQTFCQRMGHPEWQPHQWEPGLYADIQAAFQEKTRAEWLALFEDGAACVEPVLDYAESLQHPQVQHRNLVQTDAQGRPTGLNSPFTFLPQQNRPPAPALGADTREILASLDYTSDQIDEWLQKGIVRQA